MRAFNGVEVVCADQSAAEQVHFGAGEAVGLLVDWACAGAGGQHDRDARGDLAHDGNHDGRYVPGAEHGHDRRSTSPYRAVQASAKGPYRRRGASNAVGFRCAEDL